MGKVVFLIIAYGQYYHELAYNLLLSYKYSVLKEHQYPFAVITDNYTSDLDSFDDIIIAKPCEQGFTNKLIINKYTPYDETIIIDADCLVYDDISPFFDKYRSAKSSFSSFGRNIPEEKVGEINNILFDINRAKEKWPYINYVPHFNAAKYYIGKSGGYL